MAQQRVVGVKLPANKTVIHQPLQAIPAPEFLYVPVLQHQGGPGELCVKRSSPVKVGTPLTVASQPMQVPVHSPVSGVVKAVEEGILPSGQVTTVVRIENDGEDTAEDGTGRENPNDYSPEEIRRLVNEFGVVGLGGGTFPTTIKLTVKKPLETVILNGCEGEPVLSADHRVMLEKTKELVYGIKAIQIATGAKRAVIGVEPHDRSLVQELRRAVGDAAEVKEVPPVYPVSAEGVLIRAAIGKRLPPGVLPFQIGVAVVNVSTAVAIAEGLRDGRALTKRAVTVAGGAVGSPGNYLISVGTPARDVLEFVSAHDPHQVVFGGPMMGHSVPSLDVPVIKGTTGIMALSEQEVLEREPLPCVRCGRCITVCSNNLTPFRMARLVSDGNISEAEEWGLKTCMECGACAYVCPSHIPLTQLFRSGKSQLRARAAAQRRGEKHGA